MRRLLSFVFAFVLCLSLCSVAFAAESDSDVLPDGDYTVEDVPAYVAFGFDNADDFETFLYYIVEYDVNTHGEFADYVRAQYPDYDVDLAATLYKELEGYEPAPLASGSDVTFYINANSGATVGTAVWQYKDSVYGVSFYKTLQIRNIPVTGTTSNSAWPGTLPSQFTIDMSALSAGGCNWTTAQTANVVEYLRQISYVLGYQQMSATTIWSWLNQIQAGTQDIANQFSASGWFPKFQTSLVSQFTSLNNNQQTRADLLNTNLADFLRNSISASRLNGSGSTVALAVGSDVGDLLAYLLASISGLNANDQTRADTLNANLLDYLVSSQSAYGLDKLGYPVSVSSGLDVSNLVASLVTTVHGAANSIGRDLTGMDADAIATPIPFDSSRVSSDPGSSAVTKKSSHTGNIFGALRIINDNINLPLQYLQQVLADEGDLELKRNTSEQVDAVTDDFTGDGNAAPSTTDIGDMADISADFSGMLDSGVGPGELIGAVNGADTYSFFSQATSDSLDTVADAGISPAADIDDLFDLSGYVEDENGMLIPVDDFLRREG